MSNTPFDLIVISSEKNGRDEAEIVSKLFDAGLQTFHLRKPNADEAELICFLETLPKEFHNKVVLHSHFQLMERFEVKGIHLSEANKNLITEYGKYKIISASFHSLEDLNRSKFTYEYVFLSPIFDSISKHGYKSQFDLEVMGKELKKNRALAKVIALGGVTESNIHLVKDAGFSGVAMLGAVWESDDPVNAFLRMNAVVHKL